MRKDKKGDVEFDKLAKWLIALGVLALIIALIFILRGRGFDLWDKILEILRFGR